MLSEESRKKYSEASKLRQAKIDPEIRKERMSRAAKARWANKTIEEKRAYSLKMFQAKKKDLKIPKVIYKRVKRYPGIVRVVVK